MNCESSSEECVIIRRTAPLPSQEETDEMVARLRQQLALRKAKVKALNPRSGGKHSVDRVPPSRKKPNAGRPKENLKSVEHCFDAKLSLDKVPRSKSKTEQTKCKEDPHGSCGKLPLVNENNDRFGEKRFLNEALKCKAVKHKVDPEDIVFREIDGAEILSYKFATAALSYLRKKGHSLELVKPCLYHTGLIAVGFIIHFNFKAKREDDPSAPVKTYFSQLRYNGDSDIVVDCCVSLGESDSLPYKRDNRGCQYCTNYVHHPVDGCKGIIWGVMTWSQEKKMYDIV